MNGVNSTDSSAGKLAWELGDNGCKPFRSRGSLPLVGRQLRVRALDVRNVAGVVLEVGCQDGSASGAQQLGHRAELGADAEAVDVKLLPRRVQEALGGALLLVIGNAAVD
eukprot:7961499-Pyramimonas_sp.AAC.1